MGKKFEEYKNTEWIVRSKRGRLSVLPNVYSMEAVTTITKDLLGGLTWNKILLTLKKRDMYVCIDGESYKKIQKEGMHYIQNNPAVFHKSIAVIKGLAKEWILWLQSLYSKDLRTVTDRELVKMYIDYREYYKRIYGHYFVILVLEEPLTKHLKGILEKKLNGKKAAEAFTSLTFTIDAMHPKKEEKDHLQIALSIVNNPRYKKLFSQDLKTIEKELSSFSVLNDAIDVHTQKHFWMARDYEDPVLTKSDFIKRIKATVTKGNVPERAFEALMAREKNKETIRSWEKKLTLTEEEAGYFSTMRTGIYLKELRKKLVSQSLFYFDHVLEEICRRSDLDVRLARMLLPEDLEPLLVDKKPYKEILENRFNKSVYVVEDGECTLFSNEEADVLFDSIVTIDKNVKELKGMSGSAGVAKGPARIILHPSDFHKVQKGDVMITVQAVPSFIDPLRKSVALVADGGTGITSHPATLAREVGIPCVFQTKTSTEVIEDGDLVEVDGDKGVVRILEKKNKTVVGVWKDSTLLKEKIVSKTKEVYVNNFSIQDSGYPLVTVFEKGVTEAQKDLFGKEKKPYLSNVVLHFEGLDLKHAYHSKKELKILIDAAIAVSEKNPRKIETIHQKTYKLNEKFFSFSEHCFSTQLHSLDDLSLGRLYADFNRHQVESHGPSIVTTWYIDSHEQKFSKLLMKKASDLIVKSGKDLDVSHVFSTLTTSPKNSLALHEEIENLELIKEILKSKKAKRIMSSLKNFSKIPNTLPKHIIKIMNVHYEKWRWTGFNYLGPAHTVEYYLTQWASLVQQQFDLDKELLNLKRRPQQVKRKIASLHKKLNVKKKNKQLFAIGADMSFLKGYRKDCLYHGHYVMAHFFKEMAYRLNVPVKSLYFFTPKEVEDHFLGKKELDRSLIAERKKLSLLCYSLPDKFTILTGSEAEDKLASLSIQREKVDTNVSSMKGMCASPGNVKGTITIVNNVKEISKIKKGNIMLSRTTYPSLVVAMKKAAAIITEDGGLTCHAAIVSRELGTPCITGVKNALKVLKDGDIVEVDATNGIIKRLS
jgi:phosphohistidine swiveling domain-containing protein